VEHSICAVVNGERNALFERQLNPHSEPRDREWVAVDLGFERLARHHIDIEFATRCQSSIGRDEVMEGFEIFDSSPSDALAPVDEMWQSGIPLELDPDAFYPSCGSPGIRLRCRITGSASTASARAQPSTSGLGWQSEKREEP
jgi:hypothetical protein